MVEEETYIYQWQLGYLVRIASPDNPCRTTLDLTDQRCHDEEGRLTFPISNRM
jgi:hypothetical protein